jgi:DNA polymerase I-like protein with 3'-5' exonuclease and polymerase domains
MFDTTQVYYESTNDPNEASTFIRNLEQFPDIAWDFEVAVKYTPDELAHFKAVMEDLSSTKLDYITARAKINATALDHPSHCTLTHCSIAVNESEAYVFILDNPDITSEVLTYLTTTEQMQILHNASFDFKHLYYYTGKFPANYEDTQILAKTLLNHTNPLQARTGLKELAGQWYGEWGISADNFTVSQMYDPKVLKYAATDACATFKLWEYTNQQCDLIDKELIDASSLR